MNRLLNLALRAFCIILLHTASVLLPARRRTEWLHEWQTELWYVMRGAYGIRDGLQTIPFCLGSFADAFCLRRQWRKESREAEPILSSPAQCLLCLATLAVFCAILSRLVPSVGAEFDTVLHPLHSNLIVIAAADSASDTPAVSLAEFRSWKSSYQRYFDGLAFYRTESQAGVLPTGRSSTFTVALASTDMMALLGLPLRQQANEAAGDGKSLPEAVLSYEAWVQNFGSNPHIAGHVMQIGGRTVRIAGVLPCSSWKLPSKPDIWLLASNATLDSDIGTKWGYVIAHLTRYGQDAMVSDQISVTVRGTGDHESNFCGIRIVDHAAGPVRIYLFALLLALLALPAVTSVSMSESSFSAHRPSWRLQLKRWLFLVAKLSLVAAIAYFASLDIAYLRVSAYSEMAELVQLIANFLLCLLGFRWAIMEQQQRCPVCLRHVTHPARVGLASQTFLGWNGTEMMCAGGHTLLHIPSVPTSWFGAQRWLYLDTSWKFLFADLPS